jgi:Protein of unknown function (DUF3800)
MNNKYLYIFLDEGGNLDFSPSGTKFFNLTSVCKIRPFKIAHILGKYKFDLIEYGLDFVYFHCTNDNLHIRGKVFDIIRNNVNTLRIDSLIVEKRKTGPALQAIDQFYPRMLGYLLKYVLNDVSLSGVKEVIVITDSIPVKKKRTAIEKSIKVTLKSMLPLLCKYRILHHQSMSNMGLQIADYCNWAIFRKWEAGDVTFYDEIKKGVKSEFDIFKKNGARYYY